LNHSTSAFLCWLAWLVSKHHPPDLCLLSSLDYRFEPLVPGCKPFLPISVQGPIMACFFSTFQISWEHLIGGIKTSCCWGTLKNTVFFFFCF
jgi:hypothetical protein